MNVSKYCLLKGMSIKNKKNYDYNAFWKDHSSGPLGMNIPERYRDTKIFGRYL
ncbi:Uncharacterized protein dnm_019200 [Desulfonema magnum]|uniref:Uncharacterized protein n=1 Tax=Desulfonema magnum TaxID=45655 RepID=A0A975GMJ2_9BACT|nr:Uncharacterized protein dnm_019200 [Desulfonema magnum]